MMIPDARLPLYQRLHDDMVAKIIDRTWQPDMAIPTELELTKLYAASIGTVRKAVDLLVAEGLVERTPGRGTFIRRPSFDNSLFRFFRYQSPHATNRVPEGKILKRTLESPPEAVTRALNLNKKSRAIRLDRLRLIDKQPVLLEEIWLPYAKFSPLMDITLDAFGHLLYPLYEERCGHTIASAQETLTVEAADLHVTTYLAIQIGRPLIVIDRLAFGYDQQPLEWRRSRGSAETFKYQVEIR